jgi:hypothetical protein
VRLGRKTVLVTEQAYYLLRQLHQPLEQTLFATLISLVHAIATVTAVVCGKTAGEPISVNVVETAAPIAAPAVSVSWTLTVPEAPATAATFWNTATQGGVSTPVTVAVCTFPAESVKVMTELAKAGFAAGSGALTLVRVTVAVDILKSSGGEFVQMEIYMVCSLPFVR